MWKSISSGLGWTIGCVGGAVLIFVIAPMVLCGGCLVAFQDEIDQAGEAVQDRRITEQVSPRTPSDLPLEPLFRVVQLSGMGASEVDGVLGEPTQVDAISRYPENMPGETRTYDVGRGFATVRFYRDSVAEVQLHIHGNPAPSTATAFRLLGLNEADFNLDFVSPPGHITYEVRRFSGSTEGVEFQKFLMTSDSSKSNWNMVVVEFPPQVSKSSAVDLPAAVSSELDQPTSTIRTWTDSTGKFSVEAIFEGLDDGSVSLRRTDGKLLTVPLARLSVEDQRFVDGLSEGDCGNP